MSEGYSCHTDRGKSPNNRFERSRAASSVSQGGVDDWDRVPSFDAGEASRRSTSSLGAMNIPTGGALAGAAAAVGISAALIPVIHSYPTTLYLVVGLCAWGILAYIKTGPFADGHIGLVLTAAVLLHIFCFSIPA